MKKLFGRNLEDTAFSVDRLIIWAVGISLFLSSVGVVTLALTEKPESKVLNNMATFSLGSFVTLMTRNR